jgi:alkylation response protein AidB-like acyl-CoA dehydrogenase
MGFELAPVSPAGVRYAELADKHAAEFAVTAARYDRDNEFPAGNWDALRRSGFLAGTVSAAVGGTGVRSVRDLTVGVGRLARGDAATALGVAMHASAMWFLSRMHDAAAPDGDAALVAQLRLVLRRCVRGHCVVCVALSENGVPLGRPRTTATLADGGYRLDGRKSFCTNSPASTLLFASVRLASPDGPRHAFALVPRQTAGVRVAPNWDALGMRASGSGEVVFDGSPVPANMVFATGALGVLPDGILPMTVVGVLAQAAAFLGIAEQAQELAVAGATRSHGAGPARARRGAVQALIGDSEIDLAVGRATLGRAAWLVEECLDGGVPHEPRDLMREVQCANMAVKRAAVATVDRALTASGGGGYLSANPLSRLYRDVRAGLFMQPFSGLDAGEFIGRVRLGIGDDPDA